MFRALSTAVMPKYVSQILLVVLALAEQEYKTAIVFFCSRACFNRARLQAIFFRRSVAKKGAMLPGVPNGDRGNWG